MDPNLYSKRLEVDEGDLHLHRTSTAASVRTHLILGGAAVAVGAALAIRAVLGERGWTPFLVALGIVGLGVIVAATIPGRRRWTRFAASVVVAALVVAVGYVSVKPTPLLPQGWSVSAGETLIGHNQGVAVTVEADGTLRGRDTHSGNELWVITRTGFGPTHEALAADEQLIVAPTPEAFGGVASDSLRAGVLDPAAGEILWDAQVGASTLIRVSAETVVLQAGGSPDYSQPFGPRQVTAFDRTDGSQRWEREGPFAPVVQPASWRPRDVPVSGEQWAVLTPPAQGEDYPIVDLATGQDAGSIPGLDRGQRAAVVSDDVVVVTGESAVTGWNVHGEELWSADVEVANDATPDIYRGQVRVFGGDTVTLIDPQSGSATEQDLDLDWDTSRLELHPGSMWVTVPGEHGYVFNSDTGELLSPQTELRGGHIWPQPDTWRDVPHIGSAHGPDFTVWIRLSDAVGNTYLGFARATDDGIGEVVVTSGGARHVDGLVQTGNRVLPLG